ncbi:hypothetical protein C7974DRAFT_382311 [Boeremia exigua]|uniref:uncharacterized protein n=1 Tax=Boeremia exigua TaxID=749465 RepID=UPI001E8D8C2A|nr:uncharacterized protein C7974DRAFT_382311 [Boeremia exigua]KAH6643834.1 hypothetical protein C7974DRAFT_382311 [Boeremia exigua]
MSDVEPKTTGQGASAWTDTERMAYLIVIAEHALEAPIESKVSQAPVPGGRTVNACRKIVKKLKEKLKDDIDNIKAGLPVTAPPAEGEAAAKSTPRKRKAELGGDGDASPKKKATPRKKKSEATVKDEDDDGGVEAEG